MWGSLTPFRGIAMSGELPAGDGGNEKNAVALPKRTCLAAQEPDVLFIEINVEELADLPALIADVPRQGREPLCERVQRFSDGSGTTIHFRRAVRETPESRGNFNRDWHLFFAPCSIEPTLTQKLSFRAEQADVFFSVCSCECVGLQARNLLFISSSSLGRRSAKLRVQIRLERLQPRRNNFACRKLRRNRICRFQAVAGNANHRGLLRLDAVLRNQFLGDSGRNSSGGFRKDAFRFRQQPDGLHNLRVRYVFRPAARLANQLHGERPVSWITDRQRTRNSVRLLRFESRKIPLHAIRNRRAAGRLRAKEFHGLVLNPAQSH